MPGLERDATQSSDPVGSMSDERVFDAQARRLALERGIWYLRSYERFMYSVLRI